MKVGEGEIAAAVLEVFAEVAEDVDELEALAEEASVGEEVWAGYGGVVWDEVEADAGPEFADATGDLVGVVFECLG